MTTEGSDEEREAEERDRHAALTLRQDWVRRQTALHRRGKKRDKRRREGEEKGEDLSIG